MGTTPVALRKRRIRSVLHDSGTAFRVHARYKPFPRAAPAARSCPGLTCIALSARKTGDAHQQQESSRTQMAANMPPLLVHARISHFPWFHAKTLPSNVRLTLMPLPGCRRLLNPFPVVCARFPRANQPANFLRSLRDRAAPTQAYHRSSRSQKAAVLFCGTSSFTNSSAP